MPLDWLPGAERIVTGKGGGTYLGGPFRGVLHRTEGSSIEGALSVYRRVDVAPHLTVDLKRRRIVQHTPFTQASRSLENKPGGVQTNRQSTIQVEIVGFSAEAVRDSDDDVAWFGREVIGPISRAFGIQLQAPTFYGPNCGWTLASPTAKQRMSFATWNAFNGWCSHQHVPEQSHWDAGEFKIHTAFAAAIPTLLEDFMASLNDDEKQEVLRAVRAINRAIDTKQASKVDGREDWITEFILWNNEIVSKIANKLGV